MTTRRLHPGKRGGFLMGLFVIDMDVLSATLFYCGREKIEKGLQ